MNRQAVTEYLIQLPIEELVAVLRDVFAVKRPAPEEASFGRNRFFLGTAWSDRQTDAGEAEQWGPWSIDAVAYPDPARYGSLRGPDYGLCQEGTCDACGINVRSNVKQGRCPVCGAGVDMT